MVNSVFFKSATKTATNALLQISCVSYSQSLSVPVLFYAESEFFFLLDEMF